MCGEEEQYIKEAFVSNWIAPIGPQLNGFEKDLQNYNQINHAAALTSCTAAIHIALDILGVRAGDYVLVQTFTFCGSANPINYCGAQPIFIDSEPETWNMSPAFLQEALSDLQIKGELAKVKVIMPVHLYGMPAQLDAIMAIAEEYQIPVLEDAAESLGSKYREKFTGTIGKMGVYSFNGNKVITTSGGGALVSQDENLIDQSRFLATQARDNAPHYEHSRIGYNYRLSNILASIGRSQMTVLDKRIAQRRSNFDRYYTYFSAKNSKGYQIRFQEENPYSFSNRWLSAILIDPDTNNGIDREKIRLALGEENIETRPLWKPMHLQPVFKHCKYYGSDIAETLFDQGLCLPSGSNLSNEDFMRIFGAFDKLFL